MNNIKKCAGRILGALLLTISAPAFSSDWFEAARNGDVKMLEQTMKENPALLHSKNKKGYTAFILATYNNQKAYAQKLLELGADPCASDEKGNTALMGVIFKGHEDISMVIINKCDVNHRNNEGQTALMYASLFGREKVAKELIKLGAKRDLKDHEGRDALSLAEGQWNQAMVGLLKTFRIIN